MKLNNWEFSIKRIGVYYTLSTRRTLLHWNQPSAIMYNRMFLIFTLRDLWKCQKKLSFHNKHTHTHIYIYIYIYYIFYICIYLHALLQFIFHNVEKLLHFLHWGFMFSGLLIFWSFILYTLQGLDLSLKNSYYAYIPPHMLKTLKTLGNEKKQQQIKFYEKSSDELIFSQTTD